jgi:peptidoglycan hydrolase CwlO-like protein
MGVPARKFESEEVPVEERLARLEAKVDHIQSDVSEMKVDIRRLNDKIYAVDQKLSDKIDVKFNSLKDRTSAL